MGSTNSQKEIETWLPYVPLLACIYPDVCVSNSINPLTSSLFILRVLQVWILSRAIWLVRWGARRRSQTPQSELFAEPRSQGHPGSRASLVPDRHPVLRSLRGRFPRWWAMLVSCDFFAFMSTQRINLRKWSKLHAGPLLLSSRRPIGSSVAWKLPSHRRVSRTK